MSNLEQFLKGSLDNKMAYISSDGLLLGGTVGQKCKLKFVEYSGLLCYLQLGHNSSDIVKEVEQIFKVKDFDI